MDATQPAKGVVPAAGNADDGLSRRSFAQVLGKVKTDDLDDKPTDSTSYRKEGYPALRLSDSDVARGESHVSNHIVVMKFSSFRPSLDSIRKSINRSWGIFGEFIMGLIDQRHVMVYLQSEDEVKKVLSKDSSTIWGVRYKIFRWHPGFSLKADSELAPIWIELPKLLYAFFLPAIMKAIGDSFGNFLRIDDETRFFARPQVARMCVEMEVTKSLPHKIWLESQKYGGYWQKLEYPEFKYCDHCSLIGHEKDYCRKLVGRKQELSKVDGEFYKENKSLDKVKQKQKQMEEKQEYVPGFKKSMGGKKNAGKENVGVSGGRNSKGVEVCSARQKIPKEITRGKESDSVISANKFMALAEDNSEAGGEGLEDEISIQQGCQMKVSKEDVERSQETLKGAGYTTSQIQMAMMKQNCDDSAQIQSDNADNAHNMTDEGPANEAPLGIVPFVADSSSESGKIAFKKAEIDQEQQHSSDAILEQSGELTKAAEKLKSGKRNMEVEQDKTDDSLIKIDSGTLNNDSMKQGVHEPENKDLQGTVSIMQQCVPLLFQMQGVGPNSSNYLHADNSQAQVDVIAQNWQMHAGVQVYEKIAGPGLAVRDVPRPVGNVLPGSAVDAMLGAVGAVPKAVNVGPGLVVNAGPKSSQVAVPGSSLGAAPGSVRGAVSGCAQGVVPGSASGAMFGSYLGAVSGTYQGAVPGSVVGVLSSNVGKDILVNNIAVSPKENRRFQQKKLNTSTSDFFGAGEDSDEAYSDSEIGPQAASIDIDLGATSEGWMNKRSYTKDFRLCPRKSNRTKKANKRYKD